MPLIAYDLKSIQQVFIENIDRMNIANYNLICISCKQKLYCQTIQDDKLHFCHEQNDCQSHDNVRSCGSSDYIQCLEAKHILEHYLMTNKKIQIQTKNCLNCSTIHKYQLFIEWDRIDIGHDEPILKLYHQNSCNYTICIRGKTSKKHLCPANIEVSAKSIYSQYRQESDELILIPQAKKFEHICLKFPDLIQKSEICPKKQTINTDFFDLTLTFWNSLNTISDEYYQEFHKRNLCLRCQTQPLSDPKLLLCQTCYDLCQKQNFIEKSFSIDGKFISIDKLLKMRFESYIHCHCQNNFYYLDSNLNIKCLKCHQLYQNTSDNKTTEEQSKNTEKEEQNKEEQDKEEQDKEEQDKEEQDKKEKGKEEKEEKEEEEEEEEEKEEEEGKEEEEEGESLVDKMESNNVIEKIYTKLLPALLVNPNEKDDKRLYINKYPCSECQSFDYYLESSSNDEYQNIICRKCSKYSGQGKCIKTACIKCQGYVDIVNDTFQCIDCKTENVQYFEFA